MKYLDLFSGISAPTVAWKPLGWQALAYAEIEKFPSTVLAHHYPTVPNVGDVTKVNWDEWKGKADLVIAGSPCQSFSTAGKRRGLDDERGNLALEAIRIARRVNARWFILENAPGILSANKGYAFAKILHEMEQCGYGFAYRVLDAKHFGVPQRRRRVYIVGYSGDWRTPARVLFDGQSQAGITKSNSVEGKRSSWDSQTNSNLPLSLHETIDNKVSLSKTMSTLTTEGGKPGRGYPAIVEAVAVKTAHAGSNGWGILQDGTTHTLQTSACSADAVAYQNIIRRLSVVECLRLQGFPDDYLNGLGTRTAQYKAIGNSMAVPVIRWLGQRIELAESGELAA